MPEYIKRIRTKSGDLQIDYNSLANLPSLTPEGIGALSNSTAVKIKQGGTGATTATEACANIGALSTSGGTVTGQINTTGSVRVDSGTGYADVLVSRTINNKRHSAGILPASDTGNASMIYSVDGETKNWLRLSETDTRLSRPLTVSSGGTGANNAPDALKNLGLTATAAELNYCDGVTSNIQTQLNGKAASSHGTHVSYGTSASALGTSSAGSASTVSRSDHVHALPALNSCTGTLGLAKGGTNATDGATGLKNLFAAGPTVLSPHQYGSESQLPQSGVKGQLFIVV